MRWRGRRQSRHVEDRRAGGGFPGMGGMRRAPGTVKISGGGLLLLIVLMLVCGVDPMALLSGVQVGPPGGQVQAPAPMPFDPGPRGGGASPADDDAKAFVATVLAETEDTWHALLPRQGAAYREPTLVLFRGVVRSACGFAQAAMGPFYCPLDEKVYIDLAFYDDLHRRFGAPGDFAQAYVIAHEVGHHVQHLLGISDEVHRLRQRLPEAQGNELSVRLELQADCLAGVWGYHADRSRGLLEAGDAEEALRAAAAIGDDRLQRQTQGHVVPESFTHGSSEQRVAWFRRGFESGDPEACDTFGSGAR